jgi:AraC-like DNA-binding protein
VVSYITPVYGGFYIVLTVFEAYKFNKELKNEFSSIDKYNLSWVKFLAVGAILLWITAVTMSILQLVYDKDIKPELVSYLAISIFIYAMAYKGLKQPEVIIDEKLSKGRREEFKNDSYRKSGLSEEDAELFLKKLLKVMDEEKPFRNMKLSLTDLSNMVGVSTHNLSEIINKKIEQNFYDFVNSYRVEEVKKLIEYDKNSTYSILAYGFEAGFSSKSAFYSAFKKLTGQTPAQYRKEIL